MTIRTLALALVAGVAASAQAATISQWDLNGASGFQATQPGTGLAPDVTALAITRGAGLGTTSPTGAANSFTSDGWTGQATDYISFGFSVASGKAVNLSSLYIGTRSSNTGPGTLGLFYSGDGFSSSLFTFTQSGTAFNNSIINLSSLTNLTGNVEFRIRQIGTNSANGGTTASGGTFRLTAYFINTTFDRNMQFTGTVIPTPGSVALVGLAGLVAGRRRRA